MQDYYPKADHAAQWFGDIKAYRGVDMGGVDKVLWHSTEGSSWPPYDGGAKAPTLTYHPGKRAWRQHFRLTQSARALRDPSDTVVRENRDKLVQVEIVGTCDPDLHRRVPSLIYVPELSDDQLNDLAEFAAFMHTEFGVPFITAPSLPYPQSSGNTHVRFSGPQFDAFRGFLQHQNASGNDHGDAGALRAGTITYKAQALVASAQSAGKDWFDMATPKDLEDATFRVLTDEKRDVIPDTEYRTDLLVHQSLAGTVLATARAAVDVKGAVAQNGARLGGVEAKLTALTAQVTALSTALAKLQADVTAALARP